MILPRLMARYLKYGDDPGFYLLQARDTVRWLERSGIRLGEETTVLDLGCGHGLMGAELINKGCQVTFADESNWLMPDMANVDFVAVDINTDDLARLGTYDLVICSNVLEHLPSPETLIGAMDRVLEPGGLFYLGWSNWLSPWGGHEFSPFHYLGPRWGHLVYDKVVGRPRVHTPYETLFPTSIGGTLRMLRDNPRMSVVQVIPRYYPEFALITRVPGLREFLTFNCVILARRTE